jgi:hypothetical protein
VKTQEEIYKNVLMDRIKNLEFQISSTETNLHYLLGENPLNEQLISNCRGAIREAKDNLIKIIEENNLNKSLWAGFHLEK